MLVFSNNLSVEGFDPNLTRDQEPTPDFLTPKKGGVFVLDKNSEEVHVGFNVIFDKSLKKVTLSNGIVSDEIYVSQDVIITSETTIHLTDETVQIPRSIGIKLKKGVSTPLTFKTFSGLIFQISAKASK